MRFLVSLAIASFVAASAVQAEDDAPQGLIGIQIKLDDDGKVVVVEAFKDSPAAKAGIKEGDIIVNIDDTAVEGLQETVKAIIKNKPETEIEVVVNCDDKEKVIDVVGGKRG